MVSCKRGYGRVISSDNKNKFKKNKKYFLKNHYHVSKEKLPHWNFLVKIHYHIQHVQEHEIKKHAQKQQ
jgi:hypothetical protein